MEKIESTLPLPSTTSFTLLLFYQYSSMSARTPLSFSFVAWIFERVGGNLDGFNRSRRKIGWLFIYLERVVHLYRHVFIWILAELSTNEVALRPLLPLIQLGQTVFYTPRRTITCLTNTLGSCWGEGRRSSRLIFPLLFCVYLLCPYDIPFP